MTFSAAVVELAIQILVSSLGFTDRTLWIWGGNMCCKANRFEMKRGKVEIKDICLLSSCVHFCSGFIQSLSRGQNFHSKTDCVFVVMVIKTGLTFSFWLMDESVLEME